MNTTNQNRGSCLKKKKGAVEKERRTKSCNTREINKSFLKIVTVLDNFGGIPNTSGTSDGTSGRSVARRRARIRDNSWDSHKPQGVCVYRGSNKSGHLLSGICALCTLNHLVSVSQIVRSKESDGKAMAGTRGEALNSRIHPLKDRGIDDIE